MKKEDLNKLLVDALNVWYANEYCSGENKRDFKVGRRHNIKYDKVLTIKTNEIKYMFKIGRLYFYTETLPHINNIITSDDGKHKVRVLSVDSSRRKLYVEDYEGG